MSTSNPVLELYKLWDLLSWEASSSLPQEKQSLDLASPRQVGEIRDNRIKAGAVLTAVPSPLQNVSGLTAHNLARS